MLTQRSHCTNGGSRALLCSPSKRTPAAARQRFRAFWLHKSGRLLAFACVVPDSRSTASTYNEPTVMWRMQREHGLRMHVVIAPTKRGASVMWLVNGRLLGMREFTDWTEAITWS